MNITQPKLESKLELIHLLKAIDYLGNQTSSADNIHTYSQSPIHMLVHNEILKHSKKDIDNFKEELRFGKNLYSVSFEIRNPYIFSAFMKVGAFQDKISKETKWLLKQKKNPSNDLHALIYEVEEFNFNKKEYSEYAEPLSSKDNLFNCLFGHYSYNFDYPEKVELVDSYFKEFGKKMEDNFIHYIYSNSSKKSDICDYLTIKLKSNGVDLSKNNLLNNLLPKEDKTKKEQSFFISSLFTPQIKNLLEYGFTFDENNYSFYGDNLFIAIVKSKREDLIKLILPYLTDVTPKSGTLEEQNFFIDSLSKKVTNEVEQEKYQLIKTCYQKCLLEKELDIKNTIKIKNKIKV